MAGDEARRLVGQVTLVNGASSGLGHATAIALARAGADVALLARTEADLRRVAREIESTTAPEAATGALVVQAFLCPPGVADADAAAPDWFGACPDPAVGARFEVAPLASGKAGQAQTVEADARADVWVFDCAGDAERATGTPPAS